MKEKKWKWIKVDISSIEKEKETLNINKENLKKYLLENYDVTIKDIYENFSLKLSDLPSMEFLLTELVEEGFVKRIECHNYFEYDSIKKLKEKGMMI